MSAAPALLRPAGRPGRKKITPESRLLPLRGNEKTAKPMYHPLKKPRSWFAYPFDAFELLHGDAKHPKLICHQQEWMLLAIAKRQWFGVGREDDPRDWTEPVTDREMQKACHCSLSLVSVIKWDALKRGMIDVRLVGQSWCYRLRVENWAKVPDAPPLSLWDVSKFEKKDSDSADKPDSPEDGENIEGEDEAKMESSRSDTAKPGAEPHVVVLKAPAESLKVEFGPGLKNIEAHVSQGFDRIVLINIVESPPAAVTGVSPPSRHRKEKAAADDLFESFKKAFELGGSPVTAATEIECKSYFVRFDAETQAVIMRDVCTRFDSIWRSPEFTLPPLKYLKQKEWEANPIAQRKLASPVRTGPEERDAKFREGFRRGREEGWS